MQQVAQRMFLATLLIFMAGFFTVQAQILEPVKWSFSQEKVSDNTYQLKFTAHIDPGWSIYGLDIPPGGPIPTGFEFNEPQGFRFVGDMVAPRAEVKFDPNFNMELSMYSNPQVTFSRTVEVLSSQPVRVTGELMFMCCDATSCLPPDYIDFAFTLPGRQQAAATATAGAAQTEQKEGAAEESAGEPAEDVAVEENDEAEIASEDRIFTPEDRDTQGRSFWSMFITGLLGGLLALLTPCVFPMIPLTVSFFLRNADNRARAVRDAFFYGFTIIFSYVVLGLAISMIFGADTLNALATSPGFNLFFFALLIFFCSLILWCL